MTLLRYKVNCNCTSMLRVPITYKATFVPLILLMRKCGVKMKFALSFLMGKMF